MVVTEASLAMAAVESQSAKSCRRRMSHSGQPETKKLIDWMSDPDGGAGEVIGENDNF
jgi:hypothetical protein